MTIVSLLAEQNGVIDGAIRGGIIGGIVGLVYGLVMLVTKRGKKKSDSEDLPRYRSRD